MVSQSGRGRDAHKGRPLRVSGLESDQAMRVALITLALLTAVGAGQSPMQVPTFTVDPTWPKPLPNRWILGAVAGVHVDANDHVWIVHRPSTLQPNETRSIWRAAPPVLEFDQAGNLLSSWGGPGDRYEWSDLEHGIYVDRDT